jgi:hypothetical protein
MRNTLLVFVVLIICSTSYAKRIEGRIFYKNDTVDVLMNVPMSLFGANPEFIKMQYRIKYWGEKGTKYILKAHEAEGIEFTIGRNIYTMLSRPNNLGIGNLLVNTTHIFLILEIDGPMKLFTYFYTQSSGGGPNSAPVTTIVAQDVLQKFDEPLKQPAGLMFRKHMVPYFDDCPELAGMIKEKEFRRGDIVAIVNFYNSHCY